MKIPRHLKYGTIEEFKKATGMDHRDLIAYEKARLKALDAQYEKLRKKWRGNEIINDKVEGFPVSMIICEIDKSRAKCKEKITSFETEMKKDG